MVCRLPLLGRFGWEVLDGGVGRGEEGALVAVVPSDDIGRPSVPPVHFQDLCLAVGVAHVVSVDYQPVSCVRSHGVLLTGRLKLHRGAGDGRPQGAKVGKRTGQRQYGDHGALPDAQPPRRRARNCVTRALPEGVTAPSQPASWSPPGASRPCRARVVPWPRPLRRPGPGDWWSSGLIGVGGADQP